jgi:hypothetical protein
MVNQTLLCCVPGVQRFLLEIRLFWQSQGCVGKWKFVLPPNPECSFVLSPQVLELRTREENRHTTMGCVKTARQDAFKKRSDVLMSHRSLPASTWLRGEHSQAAITSPYSERARALWTSKQVCSDIGWCSLIDRHYPARSSTA